MSYSVAGNTIHLTRGDSLLLDIDVFQSDGVTPFTPASGDVIRFALKRDRLNVPGTDYQDTEVLVEKIINNSTMKLELAPNDTKNLGFGVYVYDIQLVKQNGWTDTFITASKFYIDPEVD